MFPIPMDFSHAELYGAANLMHQAAQFPDHEWGQGAAAVNRHEQAVMPDTRKLSVSAPAACWGGRCAVPPAATACRLFLAMSTCLPETYQSLPGWNDTKGRRPKEVRKLSHQVAMLPESKAAEQNRQAETAEPLAITV